MNTRRWTIYAMQDSNNIHICLTHILSHTKTIDKESPEEHWILKRSYCTSRISRWSRRREAQGRNWITHIRQSGVGRKSYRIGKQYCNERWWSFSITDTVGRDKGSKGCTCGGRRTKGCTRSCTSACSTPSEATTWEQYPKLFAYTMIFIINHTSYIFDSPICL